MSAGFLMSKHQGVAHPTDAGAWMPRRPVRPQASGGTLGSARFSGEIRWSSVRAEDDAKPKTANSEVR